MRHQIAILILLALCSCSPNADKKVDSQNNEALKIAVKKHPVSRLAFGEPVQIDSSAVVMYPLFLRDNDNNDGRDEYISKSAGSQPYYWNIDFYNTVTGSHHLLDDRRKMLIQSFNIEQVSSSQEDKPGGGKQLYYEVIINDANKDKQLDDKDPGYLFISDKQGYNFKQLSPSGYDVRSWHVIEETNKVLMMVAKPSEGEPVVAFVYDLKTGNTAKRVFDDTYINQAQKLFNKQWPLKDN
jgi:hypothetical protein